MAGQGESGGRVEALLAVYEFQACAYAGDRAALAKVSGPDHDARNGTRPLFLLRDFG